MKKRKNQRYEVSTNTIKFEVAVRWDEADVDASITPRLSVMCGEVHHEVQKPHMTPRAGSVDALFSYLLIPPTGTFPASVNPKETYHFCHGFTSLTFEYDGPIDKLQETINECERIISKYVSKNVKYYKKGDSERNSRCNVFAGTGSNIRRVA